MAESSTAPWTVSTGTLAEWFATPLGQYLLAREQAYFDRTLSDIFGFHALQIGLPECPFLRGSRITTRLTVDLEEPAQVLADPHWLPFAENAGDRWWPIAGGVYFLRATKRVLGMRVITPAWSRRVRKKALAAQARQVRECADVRE